MVCDKCGMEVTKKDKFCPKCGSEVVKEKNKKKDIPEVEEYKLKDKEIEKLSESFVSKSEKYIASLGNGYIMNYLTNKSIKKGFAFITDKRVYFKGSCLSGKGKSLVKTDEERTVDVKNITGSGFIYRRLWGILIALLISVSVALAGTVGTVWLSYDNILKDVIDDFEHRQKLKSDLKSWETILDILDEIEWENDGSLLKNPPLSDAFVGSFDGHKIRINIHKGELSIVTHEAYSISGDLSNNYPSNVDDINDDIIRVIEDSIVDLNRDIKDWHGIAEDILLSLGGLVPIALCLSLVAICCIGIKNYLLKRKTLFRIEYAGSCIAFDVSFYAKAEIDDFQKQLRRVKDFAEETATVRTVTVEAPVQAPIQSSVPDELRKYADLLKEGLISQEEYGAMKKKILGL